MPRVKACGRGEEPEFAPAMNRPAYRAWNASIVTTGTGGALPGPVGCAKVSLEVLRYNRFALGSALVLGGRAVVADAQGAALGGRVPITGRCWRESAGATAPGHLGGPAGGVRSLEDGVEMSFPLVQRWHLPSELGVVAQIPVVENGEVDLLAGGMSEAISTVPAHRGHRGMTRISPSSRPIMPWAGPAEA
jgi:hypothetical protein